MYKIIFIDIDGTLRNSKKEITTKTIENIRKLTEKEILVVLTSGRPRKYTEQISRECVASRYIITSNGGNIYDYQDNKVLYTNIMNKEACYQLYKLGQKSDVRFIMNVGESRVVNKLKYNDGSEILLSNDIKEFLNKSDVVQCTLADSDFNKINNMKKDIEKIPHVVIKNQHKSLVDSNFPKKGTIYYDIANIESSKGNAVEKMCALLNIDLKDTIAIGDDYNNISMFKKVGYSVVMDNAINEVKSYADEITKSNDEDGVAVFLDKLISIF